MLNYKIIDDYVEICIESPKHGSKTVYVDLVDFDLVNNKNWWVVKSGKTFYCCCYNPETGDRKYEMHQLLMGVKGADHIDHNGLNNRRCNLRVATKRQNLYNKTMYSTNKSGYRGIAFDPSSRSKTYRAAVKVNGKTVSGRRFKNPLLAAMQYNILAEYYYGDFANINEFTDSQMEEILKDPQYQFLPQIKKVI